MSINSLFIEPEEVLKLIEKKEINVVDIRAFWKYAKAHLPNSIWFYIPDLTQHSKGYPSKPKDVDELAKVLGKNGIAREDRIVIVYDRISSAGAAYLYWFLEYLGQEEIRLLKGGFEEWEKRNLPLEKGIVKAQQKEYIPRVKEEIRANYEEVLRVIEGKERTILLDVRKKEEVSGKIKTTPKAGKIPFAIVIDPELFVDALYGNDNALLSISNLIKDHEKIITYCTTGERASLAWLILSKVFNHKYVKLYPESYYEYSSREDAKIEMSTLEN